MSYTERLTLRVPASLADIASKIGRAFDPDTGGADSFIPEVIGTDDEGNPIHGDMLVCDTPCRPEFKVLALALIGDANALFQSCQHDYATRWPELVPPTMEECEAFLAVTVISPA